MGFLLTVSTLFLLVPSCSLLYALELPNEQTFSKLSRLLETKLSDLVSVVTRIDFASSVYKMDSSVNLEKLNGEEVLKSVVKKINDLLESKKKALKKLVNGAEDKFVNFQKSRNKPMLTLEDLSFFNLKEPKDAKNLTFAPRFRQKVSFQQSGVHIPLDIFDGWMGPRYKEAWWHDPEILNGLNWTAGLDDIFKENLKNDPSLRWQYFGSYFGFMRVYPAFRWPDHPSLPDLFDVRRRSWYIQGSVTPKDVIILIDRSGSVHGPTLDIMKITARALLNSLGENDFVNVAWFNNQVKWVIPCLDTLVQATAQIRRLLGDAVERLTESNLTSYATALDFAFEAFQKFEETKKPWTGSNCQKIIMFLSDGGTEWPSDLVTQHCNESRNGRIKIFTFACGPHPIPTVVLKEMACVTGGYFSPITALGSVRVKIQDYVKVLSRPLAYSKDEDMYQWHSFYRDVGGLGMITTLTLPVFNRNVKFANTTHLLGVMGIDIPIEEMMELFPKQLLGPFGYSFAINVNGFVIFHPRLHDHIIYIEDPPNIYLTDLEGSTEDIENMENAMIDGLSGSLKNYKSLAPLGLGHAILVDMDYFYEPVQSATFRFGIGIPSQHTVAKVRISNVEERLSLLSNLKGILLAPWKFCAEESYEDLTVEELVAKIRTNYTLCDENLIQHLLWDVEKIYKIEKHWNESNVAGVWSRFVIAASGLTLVHSDKFAEDYVRQTDPLKNNLYKRASHSSGYVVSVAKGKRQEVTVAGKMVLDNSFVAAVIGAEIEQELIQNIFDEITSLGDDRICDFPDLMHCYLLNDGGIITATNIKSSKAGDFIGVHDPELLEILLSKEIFKREYRYNYQSWCSKETLHFQTTSATRPLSALNFLLEAITSFHWHFFYTTFLYFISSVSGWKKLENTEALFDYGNHSCMTRSSWYYYTGVQEVSGAYSCNAEADARAFRASFLPNLTLIFLVAQPPCNGSNNFRIVTLDPEEDVEPDHCTRQQHYRLRPEKCYSESPKELFSDCGATSKSQTTSLSVSVLVTQALFFLLML